MDKTGITVAGSLIADQYFLIDTYPEMGRLTNIRSTTRDVGGSGNLIVDLAKLDSELEVKVSAVIGTDSNGRFVKKTLSRYPNINMRNITEKGDTSTTMIMNAQDTKQRTFFYMPGGSDEYDESYIDWEAVSANIFHLEYLLLLKKVDEADEEYGTQGARILHDARERGMKTSIDVVSETGDRYQKVVTAALKYTDYCTINETEAEGITGISLLEKGEINEINMKKALNILADYGVSTWVIIHSPRCGYGINCADREIIKVPSLCLPEGYIKGSNGAGDAYCSGVLYGAYKGQSIEEAMKLGTACAACSLSEISGTAGLRHYTQVKALFDKYHATK